MIESKKAVDGKERIYQEKIPIRELTGMNRFIGTCGSGGAARRAVRTWCRGGRSWHRDRC